MSSIIRGDERLAKYSDNQLAQLVASCICLGIDGEDLQMAVTGWQGGGRQAVRLAACAYDLLVQSQTKTVVIPPSEESMMWSSMEGGHRFHQRPIINIRDLIMGHITVKRAVTSGC